MTEQDYRNYLIGRTFEEPNKMSKLGGIPAYAVLVASISGQRWDESIADGLHQTENELVSNVPMWHLECLPDKEAATLCQMTITL